MEDYSWLRKHCEIKIEFPDSPFSKAEHTVVLDLIRHYEHSIEIPENATNGDIAKLFMPIQDIWECYNTAMECKEVCVRMKGVTDISYFKAQWWNAPFKGVINE